MENKYIKDEILLVTSLLYIAEESSGDSALQRCLNKAKKLITLVEEDSEIE